MKKSAFTLFLIASVFILPALSISHAASPSGYSENLNVYVAGSSALWSLNFQGANSTQTTTQVESLSGLTSYVLTAAKTSNALSDFQVFSHDGYRVVDLPFMPDRGIFLAVRADTSATSDRVASLFDDYLKTRFAQVSSTGSATTYFSPIDFNNIAVPTLFKLIPSGANGFTSIVTESEFLKLLAPQIVLSGVRGSSGFVRTISLSAMDSPVTQADGKLLLTTMLGLGNGSIVSSPVAGTSTVDVHVLDGFVASGDSAQVVNNPANLSGRYSFSAPLGHKISPNVTVVQEMPVVSAIRILDRGSAQQGDTISITLTLKNTAVTGTAQNIVVDDNWWRAYPGVFQLSRGNSSFRVGLLGAGQDYTNTYVLTVSTSNKSELTIPPAVSSFNFTAGSRIFQGRAVFNRAQIRLNDVGPAVSISATTDRRSGSPLGVLTHFFVTVTNSGNGPALNVRIQNFTLPSLAQSGGTKTFNFTLGYNSLADRNVSRAFNVEWQTPGGKTESLTSNTATVLFSHSNMDVPYIVASANATIPQLTGSVRSVNVTYEFRDRGGVNASAVHGAVTLPSGISCAAQNFTATKCSGDNLTIDYAAVNSKFPSIAIASLNLSRADNYVLLPMSLTTNFMNMTLHSWSSPVVLPFGLKVSKIFSPSPLFPSMSSRVTVTVTNVGTSNLYDASVTSPDDAFDLLPVGATINTKVFTLVVPQGQYAFNYTVTIKNSGAGNSSVSPVVVSMIFAGLPQNILFAQPALQILPPLSFTMTASPKTPVEGNAFSAQLVFTNPGPVSVDGVHVVIPLPPGLEVINPPAGVSVSDKSLIVDRASLSPRSTYAVNLSLRANTGLALDLSKAKLSFSYLGSTVSGSVPSGSITVNEDVTARYVEPIVLALFVLLLFLIVIKRTVPSPPPAPQAEAPRKQS